MNAILGLVPLINRRKLHIVLFTKKFVESSVPPYLNNYHYYQYTRPNRQSASSKHMLSGLQKTASGLLMHYQPYS